MYHKTSVFTGENMDGQKNYSTFDPQTRGEEIANAIIHGIGAALSIAALVLLVVYAAGKNDAWRVVSFSIYGATLIFLYVMSVLSHSFTGKIKRLFELFDFSAVYLLIAGTYTPITLVLVRGALGWTVFGVIWGLAIAGILFRIFSLGKFNVLGTIIYILMGWLIVVTLKPVLASTSRGFVVWLLAGGLCYTFGTIFYLYKKIPYHHPIWHLFVLAGSICHFFGFLFYA
jgi:hemolysin III